MTTAQLDSQTEQLLATCEETGPAAAYQPIARLDQDTGGAPIFVCSDLHLADGRQADGSFPGTENFFADVAFARCLDALHHRVGQQPAVLVLNGDVIDFLRVTRVPETTAELERWRQALAVIGEEQPVTALAASIETKERTFGLKTHAAKSVWRTALVVDGHPDFFASLAAWLARGHQVVIVKGNHDGEYYWRSVRNYLRWALARAVVTQGHADSLEAALRQHVLPRLSFVDQGLCLDRRIYVEHGHRFDPYTHVRGGAPTLPGGKELNLAFGSFFNRYLINRIELAYPFIDNVRPRQNLLALLIRERFPLALKLIFSHLPFLARVIPKRQIAYIFGPFLLFLLALGAPLALATWLLWSRAAAVVAELSGDGGASLEQTLLSLVRLGFDAVVPLLLSYAFAQLLAAFHLREPEHLTPHARTVIADHPDVEVIVFGHTHNPDQSAVEGRQVLNCGTWTPIFEASSASLRLDRTYALVSLTADGAAELLRWNDDAGRLEPLAVIRREG